MSPSQLKDPFIVGKILAILEKTAFPAACLIIEITEEVFLDTSPILYENARQLRAHSIRLAMDDFGTGYASFLSLSHFPIDILKIDKSLTKNYNDSLNRKVLLALLDLARSMNMLCVIEGIETAAQETFFTSYKADWGQGYFYDEPRLVDVYYQKDYSTKSSLFAAKQSFT